MNKLTTGKGNLISRVNELKTIGVKNHKEIPESLHTELENAES